MEMDIPFQGPTFVNSVLLVCDISSAFRRMELENRGNCASLRDNRRGYD